MYRDTVVYCQSRLTRMIEAITDYAGQEYSKEMRLLVKNQKEIKPKESVMWGKEEAKLPFVIGSTKQS
jgi:hypothetical protein